MSSSTNESSSLIKAEKASNNYPPPNLLPMPRYEVTEDIVISGIAGRFPESDNFDEFSKLLYDNVDMCTIDDRRWPPELNDGLGSKGGKLKEIDRFDASFFKTLGALAHAMDPQSRILLETCFESILDSGNNPNALRGTKTGVYVGINTVSCADGIPQDDFCDIRKRDAALWVYGSSQPLYANRISYLLDFRGPSALIDTACSSFMVAFANAVQDMRTRNCDMALVASANITQAPFSNGIYHSLGILASDGKCKVWDKKADGFIRSETVGALFLQRKSVAKRIYSTVLHAKTNTDGFKTMGIFSPYWLSQRDLLMETYHEAKVDPKDIKFFEAHGTGTNVGDPQEAKAIEEAYCGDRKEPLLLGAVKSNMGHSEGASGLNSICKVVISFENECIPANLHFEEAKPEIDGIVTGKLVPVLKNTPFTGEIAGVNSFGVGGVNAHALLKKNMKTLSEDSYKIIDTIPRLVTVSGRTENAVDHIFDFIQNNPKKVTKDFLALLSDAMKTVNVRGSSNFPHKGYMIIKNKTEQTNEYEYSRTQTIAFTQMPVWLVFSGMGSQWPSMAKSLLSIKTFADSIRRATNVLKPYNIDLMNLLLNEDDSVLKKSTTNAFVAITSMQVALYDLVRLLEIEVAGIIGHSFGEIACAYADGCLTLEQAVLTAYWRGKVVEKSNLPRGMLAAVGLSLEETLERCPEGIVAACHNGADSVTISGLYEDMKKFVKQLQLENVFVREVAGGNFPYHSPYMKAVAPELLEALNKIIPNPKPRSAKWISTSVPKEEWDENYAKYASGEYFTNNLISEVLFNEGMSEVEKNTNMLEVAPHMLFQAIFKRSYPNLNYIGLMKRGEDNLNFLLNSIGNLYMLGLNPAIDKLYPKVEWPVARGTQSLSSLFEWDHNASYEVRKYPEFHNFGTASDFVMKFALSTPHWSFLKDHAIDGKVLFPATGYLMIVWRRLAALKGQPWRKTPVAFENVRFFRPTLLSETNEVKFVVRMLEHTGEFTITEGPNIAVTGRVYVPEEPILDLQDQIKDEDHKDYYKDDEVLFNKDIYKELRIRGYDYGQKFQGLMEARGDGSKGKVKWTGNWVSFIDSMMHLALLALPIRTLFVPVGFESIRCDPNVLFGAIEEAKRNIEDQEISEADHMYEKKEFFYFREKQEKSGEVLTGSSKLAFESNVERKDEAIAKEIIQTAIIDENTGDQILINEIEKLAAAEYVDESKESILPVAFDMNFRSMVTKGVEIRGFIPANVPLRPSKKGLELEKFQFIAHSEECALEVPRKAELVEYIQVCCALAEKLYEFSGKVTKLALNGYKLADQQTVCKYLDSPKENHKLLNFIKQIINLKRDENYNIMDESKGVVSFEEAIKEVAAKDDNDLTFDLINQTITDERFMRPYLDTVLENVVDCKNLKIMELNASRNILASNIVKLIKSSSIGLVKIDFTIATPNASELPEAIKALNAKTLDWDLNDHKFINDISSLDLLVYRPNSSLVHKWNSTEQLSIISECIKPNGFLLVAFRDTLTPPEIAINQIFDKTSDDEIMTSKDLIKFAEAAEKVNLRLIGKKSDSMTSSLALFRKTTETKEAEVLNIECGNYEKWVDTLKERFTDNKGSAAPKNLWLIANDSSINGIIGLAKCLRLESGGNHVRCIFDSDGKLPSSVDFAKSPFKELKETDLLLNVYKDSKWGTYRHIKLNEEQETVETEHAYLNIVTRGDMSSFKWFDSNNKYFESLSQKERGEFDVFCNVYYSALNFKDVVVASGKVQPGPESVIFDCVIGLEFAGRRRDNGKRVMGLVPFKGIATTVLTRNDFIFEVPDDWSLEDAATVPIVYITAYYALFTRGNLQEGESVLIHSGAGGVGQAAIFICQSLNCEVFTTVGNEEKREFIKKKFNLDDDHIGNSHDTSFERQIKTVTKGKGVDIVLNSLTDDKLQASVRCLAANGRFLEIGKYDMQMNKNLGLFNLLQNISFNSVGIDVILAEGPKSKKMQYFIKQVSKLLTEGIKTGVVKPIERVCYDVNKAEDAFRYMQTGKHIGKVLIKVREEEQQKIVAVPKHLSVNATTKTWFDPSKVVIVVGGLGGFGLELTYWLVFRGARKIVLTSRKGIKNAYQKLYLKRFTEFGKHFDAFQTDITVCTHNAITIEGANALIDEANSKGPIGSIFNLALILSDNYIENQNVQTFKDVCNPKVDVLHNLDKVSRLKCPNLDNFIAFSSLTAGRGNAGQTNYGYANSAMERICENRKKDGFPGLCIQWGPIGDVGIVAEQLLVDEKAEEMMKLFSGLTLQRIASCLDVLDRLMQTSSAVLSSIVKVDLEASSAKSEDEELAQLCTHLAIDKRSNDETLGDIGLDSMMAVEIQQRLERDHDIVLSLNEVKKISVGELKEFRDGNKNSMKQYASDIKKARINLSQIKFDMPTERYTLLNDVTTGKPVILLPPVEGIFDSFKGLVNGINRPVYGLNWTKSMTITEFSDLKKISQYYRDLLKEVAPDGEYDVIARTFGVAVGMQLCRKLVPIKSLIILDSTGTDPKSWEPNSELKEDTVDYVLSYLRTYLPERLIRQVTKDLNEAKTESARVSKIIELMKNYGGRHLNGKDVDEILKQMFERAALTIKFKSKYLVKMRRNKNKVEQKIEKRLKKIHTNLALIKLVKNEEDGKKLNQRFLERFGHRSDEFTGRFDLHPIVGNEQEFFAELLPNIIAIINNKLK